MLTLCSVSSTNKISILIFFLFLLAGCHKKHTSTPYPFNLPEGFPTPAVPDHNPMTIEKVELGKKLFFDPILSENNSVSCGSCHLPELAFADHSALAVGMNQTAGMRNVPTLVNIAYSPYLFAEGEVPDLESQVLAPVLHEGEMGIHLRQAIQKLNADKTYRTLFQKAFDTLASTANLVRALACYERTLIAGNAPYDQYVNGNKKAMDSSSIRGMNLFFSERTQCASCHSGFNFTGYSFENIGLYEHYADIGKMRSTDNPEDEGKFKVPTLRNIAVTWPYMHDGSLRTLEEVIEFYNTGGKNHPNKSDKIKPLSLTEKEKKDLLHFLQSLTDDDMVKRKGIYTP